MSLFLSAFVSATVAPGGSEAVLAFLVSRADGSPWWLWLIATLGNTLGALTTWGLGSLAALGYPMEKWIKLPEQKALNAVRRWGVVALLLSWLPVVGDALCLAGGWLRLPFIRSLIAITLGKALRYAVVIYLFI